MSDQTKIGFTRFQFSEIVGIYSRGVPEGLFRDLSFTHIGSSYHLSFMEKAGQTPRLNVEKRPLGPDRSLFIASVPGPTGNPVDIVRSEKFELFIQRLKDEVALMRERRRGGPEKSLRLVP